MESHLITIAIEDEGYNQKWFNLRPHTPLKKAMDKYRELLCHHCTDARLLEFWYEFTKVRRCLSVLHCARQV